MTSPKANPGASETPPEEAGFVAQLQAQTYTKPKFDVSSTLQAELEAERQQTVRVFEAIGLGFWDWSLLTAKIWYSPYAFELLGYNREELTATFNFLAELIHPDDLGLAYEQQDGLIFERIPEYRCEFRVRHKNGSWLWVEATGRIVGRAEDGTPLRAAGTFSNITTRKQQQADAAFLLDLRAGMFELDEPHALMGVAARKLGEYLGVDRAGFGLFDHERQAAVMSEGWAASGAPPLPREWKFDDFGPTFLEHALWREAFTMSNVADDPRAADGDTRRTLARHQLAAVAFVPLLVHDQTVGLLALGHAALRAWQPHEIDLAQRVAEKLWDSVLRARAEQRRKSAAELLSMAMKLGRIGAFERDHVAKTSTISPELFQILGIQHPESELPEDWLSGPESQDDYLSIVHPEDRAALEGKFYAQLDPGHDGTLNDVHRIVTARDEIRHMAMVVRSERVINGDAVDLLRSHAIVQDVTEIREGQIEAERAREQRLKNSRLSAMGTMASTLAHELNQPLATAANLLSVIELGLESDAPVDKAHLLSIARRTNAKVLDAGRIIQSIRRFTLDGALGTTQVSLHALVDKALSDLFDGTGSKDIAFINNVPRTLCVDVDPVQIEHVLANLVRNAANALDGRCHARVRITGRRRGDMIELRVADNGPGIADDAAGDLFSPFMTSKQSGLGLGLPLCRTMVEAHGGKITLECHGADTGTTFLVTLPGGRLQA